MVLNMEAGNVFPSCWVDSDSQSCLGKCCVHINTLQIKSCLKSETQASRNHDRIMSLILWSSSFGNKRSVTLCFCYISILGHQQLSAPSSNFSSHWKTVTLRFSRASMNAFTNILNRKCPTSFMKQYHTNTQESLRHQKVWLSLFMRISTENCHCKLLLVK